MVEGLSPEPSPCHFYINEELTLRFGNNRRHPRALRGFRSRALYRKLLWATIEGIILRFITKHVTQPPARRTKPPSRSECKQQDALHVDTRHARLLRLDLGHRSAHKTGSVPGARSRTVLVHATRYS